MILFKRIHGWQGFIDITFQSIQVVSEVAVADTASIPNEEVFIPY